MKLELPFFGPLIALAIFSLPVVAQAENFQGLSGQGYKVAALSNNKAGVKGWTLSKDLFVTFVSCEHRWLIQGRTAWFRSPVRGV